RGEQPCYFLGEKWNHGGQYIFPEFKDFGMDYTLADKPILQQTEAQGHAVRAVYLYSAMADLAGEYQDEEMLKACDTLWKNITEKKMYITGSIGSSYYGECFTGNYDLPNNTNYSETCATIGLAMFSNRMFQITKNGKYMDTVETALYNTLLSGTALDGKHFFYVNPLEVVPEIAENNTSMRHIKTVRQQWFGVACCPPNIARTLESLGNYMYAVDDTTIYSNLFIGSDITADIQGKEVTVSLKADYPRNGRLEYTISGAEDSAFTLAVRKPGYSENIRVAVNGEKAEYTEKGGYIYLNRTWKDGDTVTAELDVEFRFVYCNPNVPYNMGKVALLKGPWVYCLEEVDNGKHLSSVVVDPEQTTLTEEYDENLMNGTLCVKFGGKRIDYTDVDGKLYVSARPKYKKDIFRAIPYCCWNNRGKGEMLVWMRTMDVMK
ncbi:MAG: glycoside hydrolase family 127 protein, partial [Lachnospiraceae bacterium]|nr:glycoside hydrolase family 127 protein [Lachnospiraceae bacterium]